MDKSAAPDIGLMYVESIEHTSYADFAREPKADGLDIRVESRPDPGPYMGIEWLLPTAVFVFLGKSYFDSFLKEAGKDHYHLLKKALHKVAARFFGKQAPQTRVIFSKGKSESEIPRYSILYSIVAKVDDGLSVKLLLQTDFDVDLCNEAQDAFLRFLLSVFDDSLDVGSVRGLSHAKPIGGTLLLAYDSSDKILVVIDPLANRRGPGA